MLAKAASLLAKELTTFKVLTSAGVIRPYPPSVLAGIGKALQDWGRGPAGGFATLAQRFPDQDGVIDELGSLTFMQVQRRSNALAHSLRELGVREGDSVALLFRNTAASSSQPSPSPSWVLTFST